MTSSISCNYDFPRKTFLNQARIFTINEDEYRRKDDNLLSWYIEVKNICYPWAFFQLKGNIQQKTVYLDLFYKNECDLELPLFNLIFLLNLSQHIFLISRNYPLTKTFRNIHKNTKKTCFLLLFHFYFNTPFILYIT